jgi:hypothetical protein
MPDLKISQLPVASATTGAELFPVVQGGVTRRIALNAVRHIGSAVFDANGSMAVDTNTLFVDAVNNRVGIGTVTPNTSLQVSGDSFIGVTLAGGMAPQTGLTVVGGTTLLAKVPGVLTLGSNNQLLVAGDVFGEIDFFSNDTSAGGTGVQASIRAISEGSFGLAAGLGFYTGTVASMPERMRLDASGNLGLGVTPSAWATYRAIQLGATASAVVDSSGGFGSNYYFDGTNYRYVSTSSAALWSAATGQHRWYTAPSGTAGNAITLTQAMTLDANENLLVGTAGSGADGISVVNNRNLSFTESAGVSLVNLFRQAGSGGTSLANGYRYSATSNAVASSTGNASAKTAIILAAGSIQFYADLSTTVAAGTNITPTERVRIKRDGQLRFVPLASAPTIDVENGDVYYDSTTNKLRVRAAGAWTDLH